LILSHVPFGQLGLPPLTEKPVKDVSESVMELTIPFALGWGAVLTGTAMAVHMVNQKKAAAAVKADEEKTEEASK
jgi:hypothetical protein